MNDNSIAFLVYDSRSGSTVLSRQITKYMPNVFVTPEIDFSKLLNRQGYFNRWAQLFLSCTVKFKQSDLTIPDGLRNLAVSPRRVREVLQSPGSADVIRQLLALHVDSEDQKTGNGRSTSARYKITLVKNGSHVKRVTQLRNEFGKNTQFIFLHRDPRDVIASKCVTPRPYVPNEVMAWGGVFLAAVRWHRYVMLAMNAKQSGAHILFLSYEQFVENPDHVLSQVAFFLRVRQFETGHSEGGYTVPVLEQGIHQLALQNEVVTSRQGSWRESLDRADIVVIEYVCRASMKLLGYSSCVDARLPETTASVSKAILVTVKSVLIRYLSRVLT